jgi:ribosome maturation factor RimP
MGIIRYTVRWDEQKRKWCVRGKIDNKYGYEVERCFDYEWQANEELEKLLKNNKAN